MIFVLDTDKRMKSLCGQLKGNVIKINQSFNKNDILIFPLRWEEKLKEYNLSITALNNLIIFIPFKNTCLEKNNKVYAYMEDVFVQEENAKLTSLGIINYLSLEHISLIDLNIDIIGYGKCAKSLAVLCDYLNIKYRFIYYKSIKNGVLNEQYTDKARIIINTAPKCILDKNDKNLIDVQFVLDISSNKCMCEIMDSVNVIFPGSLPEKYFCDSSASLIETYIRRVINGE